MTPSNRLMTDMAVLRPRLSAEDAQRMALDSFGVVGTARELPGYCDGNFAIRSGDGDLFVLKLSEHGVDPAVIELQNRVMAHLGERAPQLAIQRPCPSVDGASILHVEAADGREHLARLLTWLPGTTMAEVSPHPPELLEDLGSFLGEMDEALLGIEDPAMHRESSWDLARGVEVIDSLRTEVIVAADRELIDRYLLRFKEDALPRFAKLRRSLIHGDANDYNVLVEPGLDGPRLAGLLDFGDLLHSFTIGEVAIASAYAMLAARDPLAAAASILRGYHARSPIPDEELESLFDLVCLRLCVSVVISARQRRCEPDREYLSVTEAPAWETLRRLVDLPPQFAHAMFRDACGLEPWPSTAAVVAWMTDHSGECLGVIDAGSCVEEAEILDLSLSSPAVEDPSELRKALAEKALAIGRHGECRWLEGIDVGDPDPATLHLGCDLFVAEGTDVHAPIDGSIHGVVEDDHGATVVIAHSPRADMSFFTIYSGLASVAIGVGELVVKGHSIGAVGRAACGKGAPCLHVQLALFLGDRLPPAFVPASQESVWRGLCPDPAPLLGVLFGTSSDESLSADEIEAMRRAHLADVFSLSYRRPLNIVRGLGQYLFDEKGRAYLDAVNNVPCVGHCHPRVVAAGREQMGLLNTNTRYLHETVVRYADRLAATLPEPLEVCFFVCSGSEANELALRLARAHTGGRDCIVIEGAYHGNTSSLVEMSPYKFDGPGGAGAPGHVRQVGMPDTFRGSHRDGEAGRLYAEQVRDAARRIEADDRRLAAFFAEPWLGCGGQIIPPPGYLVEAYHHAREAGGVCVADEVQTGFGRAGTAFWAFETHGVVPDIVTLGKPMGNGHPIGAVVTTREIAASFDTGMEYFNTFGGNPVSCAIGMAVLDVIVDEGLQENARRTGGHLLARLRDLQETFPLIGDVRGQGLFAGIELVVDRQTRKPAERQASYLVERMKDEGVLLSTDGPSHNVLKIKPPLVFDIGAADRLCDRLGAILGESAVRDSGTER